MKCQVTITDTVAPGTDPAIMVLPSRDGGGRHVFRRKGEEATLLLDLSEITIQQLRQDGYRIEPIQMLKKQTRTRTKKTR